MRLTIARLGHLGDGIADGPVFVPRALPGEVIEGEVHGGRVEAPAIVTPSPDRRRPPCRHYATCGGCALMHATDDFVAGWKIDVVRAALAAQGVDAPVTGIATSPARSRRRATLAGRRTKKGAIVGFHGRASEVLVDLTDCHLLRPELVTLLPALREITVIGASRKGELALAVTVTEDGPALAVTGGRTMEPALLAALAAIAERAGLSRLDWNEEPTVVRHAGRQRFGRARVAPPAGAFLQATAEGEAALVVSVLRAVGHARRVADLFSGCGTFTFPLAEHSAVHAVEGEAAMIATLDAAARHTGGLHAITTETRDLFRRPLLPDELAGFDAVVIDPPRAGAEAQARELAASRVPLIAHVSCSPVSFARDARILLAGGYRIDEIEVVDQFRWSPHVELAARFSRV